MCLSRAVFFFFFFPALFDTRKGSQPIEVTPIEVSHKDPVHQLIYPSSKTGEHLSVLPTILIPPSKHVKSNSNLEWFVQSLICHTQ